MASNTHHYINKNNRALYLSDNWKRLISLIKHNAAQSGIAVIEGVFGAGKSTFIEIAQKRLLMDDSVKCFSVEAHPLMTFEQIMDQVPEQRNRNWIIFVDDAHELDPTVLQQFQKAQENLFWVLVSEPSLSQQQPWLSSYVQPLPLLNQQECRDFVQKQLDKLETDVELSSMQNEELWLASDKGLPAKIIEQFNQKFAGFAESDKSRNYFENANKGQLTTWILAFAVLAFILFIIFKPSDEANQQSKLQSEEGSLQIQDGTTQDPVNQDSLTQDPIAQIVQEKQSENVLTAKVIPVKSFNQWLSEQPAENFSIQLFSDVELAKAKDFQGSLDLAESYVYAVNSGENSNRQIHHRVIWGSFTTRQDAEKAIQSLPKDILEQKPWIRQFSTIFSEVEGKAK